MDSNIPRKKSLSKPQMEALLECHKRELMHLPPCTIIHPNIKGLLLKKYVFPAYATDDRGKETMAVYLTNTGRQYLAENI